MTVESGATTTGIESPRDLVVIGPQPAVTAARPSRKQLRRELIDRAHDPESTWSLARDYWDDAEMLLRLADILEAPDKLRLKCCLRAHQLEPSNARVAARCIDLTWYFGAQIAAVRFYESLDRNVKKKKVVQREIAYVYRSLGWLSRFDSELKKSIRQEVSISRKGKLFKWSPMWPLYRKGEAFWVQQSRFGPIGTTWRESGVLESGPVDLYLELAMWEMRSWWIFVWAGLARAVFAILAVVSGVAIGSFEIASRTSNSIWTAAIFALCLLVSISALVRQIWKSDWYWQIRRPWHIMLIACLALPAGFFLKFETPAIPGSQYLSFALLSSAISVSLLTAFGYLIWLTRGFLELRATRKYCRAYCWVKVRDTLAEMRTPDHRNDMTQREAWAKALERAAEQLPRFVGETVRSEEAEEQNFPYTGDRAAAGMLHIRSQLLAPTDETWSQIVSQLETQSRALATGNFQDLIYRQRPRVKSKSRRARAVEAARSVILATLPLVIVISARKFGLIDSPLRDYAQFGAVLWALIYALVALDPTIADKLNLVRGMSDVLGRPQSDPKDDKHQKGN